MVALFLFSKGITGALAPFSYLVTLELSKGPGQAPVLLANFRLVW